MIKVELKKLKGGLHVQTRQPTEVLHTAIMVDGEQVGICCNSNPLPFLFCKLPEPVVAQIHELIKEAHGSSGEPQIAPPLKNEEAERPDESADF